MNQTQSPVPNMLAADFGKAKTLQELAAEQGVRPIQDVERFLGQGDDIWASDAEFAQFLEWLQRSRQAGE